METIDRYSDEKVQVPIQMKNLGNEDRNLVGAGK